MMRQSTLDMDDLRKRRSLVITRKEAAEALGVDPRTIFRHLEAERAMVGDSPSREEA